jgi:hypothetical protein
MLLFSRATSIQNKELAHNFIYTRNSANHKEEHRVADIDKM